MTKAFTPQGLLSAGIQDKQDRSAKRQEELARETGASLINVPNKPPPPQTGLLGAITAHERERKREGGVGAALTEREREKRLAEERQRRYDEQQRQQMEQMQQGGSMYAGGGYGYNPMMNPMMMGMNPMMMNPMMTGGGMNPMMTGGMNPMMTGGGMMGYPSMLNPQQMFAAQQAAAAAYQQAMMAFSNAGSQVGGENGNAQGTMPGFDPRMSMMGMPPMMGGGMGMMSPTMTGNFDSRFPPGTASPNGGVDGGLLPPTGLGQYSSSRNSSPVMRGSPLARPAEGPERSATPKH
jgi:CCR4-NOT transcriptional complex subunit CAF120